MSLAFSRALGKVVVHVGGPLDARTGPELEHRMDDLIDGQGNRQLVVDLAATTFVDAAGLSVLVHALERVREAGGDLTLTGVAADVSRVLEAAGLDRLFPASPGWAPPGLAAGGAA